MSTDGELPQVHIDPGESHLIRQPGILRTLLGSCVGITFWVERLRIGALCHPMLPAFPTQQAAAIPRAAGLRYVDFAIRDMAAQLDALGAARSEVEVKIFGGADVLDVGRHHSRPTVGRLNGEVAVSVLRAEGYKVAASSLGGREGVHIQFNTLSGEVLLRRFGRLRKASRHHHSDLATCHR